MQFSWKEAIKKLPAKARDCLRGAGRRVRQAAEGLPPLPEWTVFLSLPLALVYYEFLFKLSTAGRFTLAGTVSVLLFSLCYGGVLCVPASVPRKQVHRSRLLLGLLGLTALPYLIEYFVYRAFHVFYDLNTVLGGVQDAVGGFGGDILHLIFSVDGLVHIFLYFLPALVFAYLRGSLFVPRGNAGVLLRVLGGAAAAFLAAVLLVAASPLQRRLYRQDYSFQSAIREFGLLSALRLDAGELVFGTPVRFDMEPPAATPTTAPESEPTPAPGDEPAPTPTPAPVVYAPNSLDIDFAALAATASGTQADLDAYVATLTPSLQNEYTGLFAGKNLIFVSAEAFCAEVIDPELTPTLYRLATRGIRFTDYYQPASAGTTGGECANLLGVLPMLGGRSMKNIPGHALPFTLGNQLNALGYYGMAFHNNDYTYYDRNLTHNALGYSQGFMGYGNGMEAYVTDQWPQSDLEMIEGTLPLYLDHQPFNIYYMSVSGHSPYLLGGNAMSVKHWDEVQDLPYSDTVRAYIAANLELEDAMAYLVTTLEEAGIADDTVICLTPDHFPYGLDIDSGGLGQMKNLEELYGAPVNDYLYRDHSCLLLWSGCLEEREPVTVSSPTFSLDILPTLSNLFGLAYDSRLLPGRDVFSDAEALVFDTSHDWKTDLGTYIAESDTFTPADPDAVIPEGYLERIHSAVRNKLNYCRGVLSTDYFAHVLSAQTAAP